MSLNLGKLAEALKVDTSLSYEDRVKLQQMRETGFYGCESAKEELYAGRILKRISELVEKVDNCLVVKDINEELPFENDVKTDIEILANWCKDIMNKVEQIAKEELYAGSTLKRMSELIDSIKEDKATNEILATWCIDFMNKIKEIAKEKYPNVTYWCDTGSDYNVIMAMLEQFRKDL